MILQGLKENPAGFHLSENLKSISKTHVHQISRFLQTKSIKVIILTKLFDIAKAYFRF
jgi:hypothetical protein